jgi:hypothetical protein
MSERRARTVKGEGAKEIRITNPILYYPVLPHALLYYTLQQFISPLSLGKRVTRKHPLLF